MAVDLGIYEKAMPESFSFADKLKTAVAAGFDYLEISIDESDKKLSRVLDGKVKKYIIGDIRSGSLPVKTMCLSGHRKYPLG